MTITAPRWSRSSSTRARRGALLLSLRLCVSASMAFPLLAQFTSLALPWRHDNARSLRRYQPESIGPGVAIFDYNRDGRMDIFFPNSGTADFFQPAKPLRSVLYRNDGNSKFTDVAVAAGVADPGFFALGASAADYDNDGHVDLLVTGYPHNALYRNRGDGTFENATRRAGLDAPGIFTSAVWLDYDANGTLDLFIAHFVRYSKQLEQDCKTNGVYHYCYP